MCRRPVSFTVRLLEIQTNWGFTEMSEIETCPKCSASLPSRFSTGRIICSRCGWTDKPKNTVASNVNKQRTSKSTYPGDLVTSFRRRFSDFIESAYRTDTLFLLDEKLSFAQKDIGLFL
jgi:ribosomal protein L37AE/L43A